MLRPKQWRVVTVDSIEWKVNIAAYGCELVWALQMVIIENPIFVEWPKNVYETVGALGDLVYLEIRLKKCQLVYFVCVCVCVGGGGGGGGGLSEMALTVLESE